jgi:CO/xanthine dehydrogenase Mo-binding subunit
MARTVAVSGSDAGAYPLTSTAVRVHADGSATIMTGSTERGQGSPTVLPQIAAEELGIAYDKVNVVSSDTASRLTIAPPGEPDDDAHGQRRHGCLP